MNNKRGGKRIGAGRKKGLASISAEKAREYTVKRIAEELEPLLTGQIELAKGLYTEIEDEQEGIKKVYQKAPDYRVGAFLLNQLIGKAKETSDINIEGSFSLSKLAQMREESRKQEST